MALGASVGEGRVAPVGSLGGAASADGTPAITGRHMRWANHSAAAPAAAPTSAGTASSIDPPARFDVAANAPISPNTPIPTSPISIRRRNASAPMTAAYINSVAPMPMQQRRLVVGAERLDREVLHERRHVVDHAVTDIDHRRPPLLADSGDQFGNAEGNDRSDDPCDSAERRRRTLRQSGGSHARGSGTGTNWITRLRGTPGDVRIVVDGAASRASLPRSGGCARE